MGAITLGGGAIVRQHLSDAVAGAMAHKDLPEQIDQIRKGERFAAAVIDGRYRCGHLKLHFLIVRGQQVQRPD
ncbi:hypothetical protein D9M71_506880 [compost metagenome]